MFYAKLTADKKVEQYPYTLTDLRIQTPNTSFPKEIDDATALFFGVVPVTPTTPPPQTFDTNLQRTAILQDDTWVEEWVQTPATPEQIEERTAAATLDARLKRNQLLTDCDWTQLPDAPAPFFGANEWTTYRQKLRDITSQAGFPWEITWPEIPN